MTGEFWEWQDIKLGQSGLPENDIVIVANFNPPMSTEEAKKFVRRRMQSLYKQRASVEGVRLLDDTGSIIARCTVFDVMGAPSSSEDDDA